MNALQNSWQNNYLRRKWEQNFLRNELLLAALLTFGYYLAISNFKFALLYKLEQENKTALYSSGISVYGSLLGFGLALVTFILPLIDSPLLKLTRETPSAYKSLWITFTKSIKTLAFAALFSTIGLFLDSNHIPNSAIFYFNVFFFFLSVFRIGRCIWIIERFIFSHLRREEKRHQPTN